MKVQKSNLAKKKKFKNPRTGGTGKIDFTVFLISAGLASLCNSLPPSTCFTFTQTHVLLELRTGDKDSEKETDKSLFY